VITGKVGSGKSFGALTMALANDPGFCIDRVVFTRTEFMELVRSLEKGSFIVGDEIGSWMDSRDWNTLESRKLSKIIETFRHKQLGVIWTVPQLRQVDINIRTMGDTSMETLKVHRRTQEVETKFKIVETNPLSGDVYRKFPVITNDIGKVTVNRLFLDRPPKSLEKLYLKKKEEFTERLNARTHDEMKHIEKGLYEDDDGDSGGSVKPNVKCDKCGYEWVSKSKSKHPCCSMCRSYTTTRV